MRSLASFRPDNKSPVPFTTERRGRTMWNLPGRQHGDYVQQMETYGEDGNVFPVVNRLMSAVSSVEWKLWKKSASGAKEDRTEVTSHGVLDLLENPNPFMSRKQLMAAGQQHNDLTGETNLIVGRAPGVKYPIDLYPCRPDRLQPVPDRDRFLAGWVYSLGSERVPLENDELLRWTQPSPLDPYRGMGPIQSIMRRLNSEKYGQEWQAAFFANSARPGGIIEVDRRLGDDEFKEMTERWRDQHQGVSKAHRVAVIENGAKWIETSYSLRDLQMAELSTVSRDVVLVAFGFPKAMLGIVEDVNRANAEAGEYMFARWLTVPRLDDWKGMFNRQLLPLFDKNLNKRYELDYESPVPENDEQAMMELEKKGAFLIAAAGAGFEVPEVLEFLNWPSLKYTAPPPPTIVAPPGAKDEPPAKKAEPKPKAALELPAFDAAMRWVVKGEDDPNACDPCKKNHGKLYRSRAAAYADYPGGAGYIKCVGAEHGNKCRCTIVKRRGQK